MFQLCLAEDDNGISRLTFSVPQRLWDAPYEIVYQPNNQVPNRFSQPFEIKKHQNNGSCYLIGESNPVANQPLEDGTISLKITPQQQDSILLGKWSHLGGGWAKDPGIEPYPARMIGFSLTNQCNLRCYMCWQKERGQAQFLSAEVIGKVVETVKILGRPPIYLWGGEPLLHPEIWKIVRMIKENGLFCIINTNGVLLEKNAAAILDSGVDMIIVSIDGPETLHDQIRGGKGVFRTVLQGLKKLHQLKKRRPLITINCVITEANYQRLDELVTIKNESGAEYLEFQFLIFYTQQEQQGYKARFQQLFGSIPNSVDGYSSDPGNIDLEKLWEMMNRINQDKNPNIRFFPYSMTSFERICQYFQQPEQLKKGPCENLSKSFWVESNGNVIPCSIFPDYVIGNIYQEGIFQIWNNQRFYHFRKQLNHGLFPICYRCCDLHKTSLFQGG